jgi:TRAP-type C4-dicarboxylate transport system substrate-binding protein
MTPTRRHFLALAGGAVAAPALLREGYAQAPEVTLKMHHFLPAISNGHAKFLAPWAKLVAQESNGRIKIDIFPAMQLGGTPPQLYDQARDGVADIVWTLPGNTPGRFPICETFELPFTAHRKAVVNSKALQEFAELHMKDEF